jgi:phage terminase Nu1 subunit (DNA packaging protein)
MDEGASGLTMHQCTANLEMVIIKLPTFYNSKWATAATLSKIPSECSISFKALLTYQRIDFLGLLPTQRRTASAVSPGLVLKDIFEDGGAF